MPFALLIIGLIAIIAAYNNSGAALASQLKSDLSGSNGFFVWFAAILIIGAIGYVKAFESVSRIFLLLIIVVVLLSNQGFFQQLASTVKGTGNANSQ